MTSPHTHSDIWLRSKSYLAAHYVTEEALCHSGLDPAQLRFAQYAEHIPKASYEIGTHLGGGWIRSFLFGMWIAPPGEDHPQGGCVRYYPHTYAALWARYQQTSQGLPPDQIALDRFLDFSHHLAAAWRTLATEEGWNGLGLPCWLQHSGEIIQQDAFAHYVAHTWMHWLNGSHGVSLRGAEGPKDIAYKDHRVGVLRALHMGHRAGSLSQAEQNLWEQAARDYHRCVMDFSPHEVHLTSRHRFGL